MNTRNHGVSQEPKMKGHVLTFMALVISSVLNASTECAGQKEGKREEQFIKLGAEREAHS